jgi:hypothetical protein
MVWASASWKASLPHAGNRNTPEQKDLGRGNGSLRQIDVEEGLNGACHHGLPCASAPSRHHWERVRGDLASPGVHLVSVESRTRSCSQYSLNKHRGPEHTTELAPSPLPPCPFHVGTFNVHSQTLR